MSSTAATTTMATETTGTRHALSAVMARTPSGALPSSACEVISQTPSTTPRMATNAAMTNVTGMVACTDV